MLVCLNSLLNVSYTKRKCDRTLFQYLETSWAFSNSLIWSYFIIWMAFQVKYEVFESKQKIFIDIILFNALLNTTFWIRIFTECNMTTLILQYINARWCGTCNNVLYTNWQTINNSNHANKNIKEKSKNMQYMWK